MFGKKKEEKQAMIRRSLKCPHCERVIFNTVKQNWVEDEDNQGENVLLVGCPHCEKVIGTLYY